MNVHTGQGFIWFAALATHLLIASPAARAR
jgi:hypothetical protein